MSKEKKLKNFNPNTVSDNTRTIFGLPFTSDEAEIVLVPVPWDATVSYHAGTARGPETIFNASLQVDLFDPLVKDCWKIGVAMEEISKDILKKNNQLRKKASAYIRNLENGITKNSPRMKKIRNEVNTGCHWLKEQVKRKTQKLLEKNKLVGLIGGEHSIPLGLLEALSEKHISFGILQLDAHCDLRPAYEGFEYSHASIMYNALKLPSLTKLVQVGIRDWCEEEDNFIRKSNGRVVAFFDYKMKNSIYAGDKWKNICSDIVAQLPEKVYISFDIDGLDCQFCPGTGTPVPGGLGFDEAVFLITEVVKSGRQIIGFDLNEVAPSENDNEWNGNVGARVLFRVCNLAAVSNGLAEFNN